MKTIDIILQIVYYKNIRYIILTTEQYKEGEKNGIFNSKRIF